VIKVSVRPAPHAVPRSALATLEIMAAATVAHTWAGGALPSVPWLLGVTGMVFGASLLGIRGLAPLRGPSRLSARLSSCSTVCSR